MDASAQDHGHMDIREQRETFHAFIKMSKWGSLAIGVGVLLFTVWFCTDAGFIPAAISALVMLVAGIMLLREKPKAPGSH